MKYKNNAMNDFHFYFKILFFQYDQHGLKMVNSGIS